jgi:hypothetical protein
MGSVADGLRPAEENDVLELDEREDLCPKTVEQTVALGGPLTFVVSCCMNQYIPGQTLSVDC